MVSPPKTALKLASPEPLANAPTPQPWPCIDVAPAHLDARI